MIKWKFVQIALGCLALFFFPHFCLYVCPLLGPSKSSISTNSDFKQLLKNGFVAELLKANRAESRKWINCRLILGDGASPKMSNKNKPKRKEAIF